MNSALVVALVAAALVASAMGSGVVFKDDTAAPQRPAPPAAAVNATFGEGRHLRGLRLPPGELDASLQDGGYAGEDAQQGPGGVRHGKNLLDWIGLGTGPETDPYLAKINNQCLEGDFSECFKSRALSSLDDFFDKDLYPVNDNARVIRLPGVTLRSLAQEPYEFSTEARAEEPEWDQFVKFLLRRVERFLKSTAIEVNLPQEVTGDGKYAPRFIDDIATEVDYIEDKTDTKFSRFRLKKLLIPMLVILKLFKLKLLLFLPLILGLASFKKVLGFFALVVPGLIGFFKFCGKSDLAGGYGSFGHSNFYKQPPPHRYPPHHQATPLYPHGGPYHQYAAGSAPYTETVYQRDAGGSSSISFRDPEESSAHDLAYQGYQNYRK
ncbi:hypothetical protein ONE63_010093 [Megalurothrips usitatus]|uniref:Protein osiris 2 n=1 Tax=Megalurothrips usitatus TaxID=439358 RepID=A0AAV7XKW9_9NEOP|nr:hypothetical protein ONE63_010093 [Megalurothrips usitatus]